MAGTMNEQTSDMGTAAREVSTSAKQRAGDVASTAGDEARAVAQDATEQARQVITRSRDQLRTEASNQTTRLAGTLRDVGNEIRAMTRGEASPDSSVSTMTSQLADSVSSVAQRLDDRGLDGAIADVKRFARNHPGAFLAGALGTGFVLGRVLKAVDTRSLMEAARGEGDKSMDPSYSSRVEAPAASSFAAGTVAGGSYGSEPLGSSYDTGSSTYRDPNLATPTTASTGFDVDLTSEARDG